MHEKYMKQIIQGKNEEAMDALGEVFNKAMDYIEECDEDMYEALEKKLYVAIYGKKINEKMAEKIIMNMKPYHMKWSLDEVKSVMRSNGINLDDIDFWVVMNMAWNDYHELFEDDIDKYIKYSEMFINDDDAKEGKVFTYFTSIPK